MLCKTQTKICEIEIYMIWLGQSTTLPTPFQKTFLRQNERSGEGCRKQSQNAQAVIFKETPKTRFPNLANR